MADNFIELNEWNFLRAGQYPRFSALKDIYSPRGFVRNLLSGIVSPLDALLFAYALLDLSTKSDGKSSELDQMTLRGFLEGRFYRTRAAEGLFEDSALKGISVPGYEVSAMVIKNVAKHWINYPRPLLRIVRADLQTSFIGPISKALEGRGCAFRLRHKLRSVSPDGGVVKGLIFETPEGTRAETCDVLVLAIPVERLTEFVGDDLYTLDPDLGNLFKLRSRPMVAIDVELTEPLPDMPAGHVTLVDSRFDLTLIDLARVSGGTPGARINAIASDYESLHGLSDALAEGLLLEEIRKYIPAASPPRIRSAVLQRHHDAPFFLTPAGAWQHRPESRTRIKNLYLAGDFVRSPADIACMEGAVTSGLRAAEAICLDAGRPFGRPVLVPREAVRPSLKLLKWLLLPAAVACKLLTLLRRE